MLPTCKTRHEHCDRQTTGLSSGGLTHTGADWQMVKRPLTETSQVSEYRYMFTYTTSPSESWKRQGTSPSRFDLLRWRPSAGF